MPGAMSDRIQTIVASIRAALKEPTQREEIVDLAATLAYWKVQAEAALDRGRQRSDEDDEDEGYRLGKPWLTLGEAAKLLRCSVRSLSRRRNQLPYIQRMPGGGRRWLVNARELQAAMRARRG